MIDLPLIQHTLGAASADALTAAELQEAYLRDVPLLLAEVERLEGQVIAARQRAREEAADLRTLLAARQVRG